MVFNSVQKSILQTILYSDIFNFPLREDELYRGLITDVKVSRKNLIQIINGMKDIVSCEKGFYFLKGKERIAGQRLARVNITKVKLEIARRVAGYLSYLPMVYFVGITGRLAHDDADVNDDIDLIIVTKKNTLWSGRLAVLLILEFLNVRRGFDEKNPSNKICPNLIIDESALAWDVNKRDLYTAHEMINIYPLMDKKNIFKRLLDNNRWISRYYANFIERDLPTRYEGNNRPLTVINIISYILTLRIVERVANFIQMSYMSKKITNETILPNYLAFHPHDSRGEIMHKFDLKKRRFDKSKLSL